jgi:hypothetical protein
MAVKGTLRPDGFALGLLVLGIIMFFVPLMRMPGLVSVLASLAYWATMVVVRSVYRRRI